MPDMTAQPEEPVPPYDEVVGRVMAPVQMSDDPYTAVRNGDVKWIVRHFDRALELLAAHDIPFDFDPAPDDKTGQLAAL
jgi:hypothetical protein